MIKVNVALEIPTFDFGIIDKFVNFDTGLAMIAINRGVDALSNLEYHVSLVHFSFLIVKCEVIDVLRAENVEALP